MEEVSVIEDLKMANEQILWRIRHFPSPFSCSFGALKGT